jgi:small subunit ribosomal protein S5
MAKNSPEHNKNKEEQQQFIEKLICVRRVTKVVKGGKTMRFSALVVVGDGKGQVGFGTGKAREVADAVKKAATQAKRELIRVPLREGRTIHHDITCSSGAGLVVMRSAVAGTGVIAGGAMRAVFEALGVQDVVAKSLGSSNFYNVVRATFSALKTIASPRGVAMRLGVKLNVIVDRRDLILGRKTTPDSTTVIRA